MYEDLLSSEARQRIARIQREAAFYRDAIDDLPLHFGSRAMLGRARRILAAGLNRLASAIAPN